MASFKLSGTDGTKVLSWELGPGTYRVGRVPESQLWIPNTTVSRNHAEIEISPTGAQCFIRDLGSHNGTKVNGAKLETRRELYNGDVIMFGQTEFQITVPDRASQASRLLVRTVISDEGPSTSVFLPIKEALKPLPKKAADLPEFVPAVSEMARMLALTDPKEVMLEKSLKLIARVIPSERLLIIFVDGDSAQVAASLLSDDRQRGELVLSRTIVHEIMANKNSVVISDAASDPRFGEQKSIIMSALKSAMAVPLFDEGRVLGILYADTTSPLQRYDDDYLRVLATFGNIIASRLSTYQLLREREQKRLLEVEMDHAAQIQRRLLDASPPDLPGYALHAFQEPSRAVGGDLYDLKVLNDGRLFFMVADVSGKGMGAALLMSNILASFRILYDGAELDLPAAVRRVSLQLCAYGVPGNFATLFCGILEPARGRFNYINAGHNPPLLVRDDGRIELIDSTGMMIGAFDFCSWEQGAAVLAEGDSLVVYSDGVTEAQNDAGLEYGDERMHRIVGECRKLHPREITGRLIGDIGAFVRDTPRFDDQTIVIVKRSAS
jgi:serine phosphatase RsbU (regulator of sigma subunit)